MAITKAVPHLALFPSGHICVITALVSGRSDGAKEGSAMEFYAVLDQVIDLLRQRGRVT